MNIRFLVAVAIFGLLAQTNASESMVWDFVLKPALKKVCSKPVSPFSCCKTKDGKEYFTSQAEKPEYSAISGRLWYSRKVVDSSETVSDGFLQDEKSNFFKIDLSNISFDSKSNHGWQLEKMLMNSGGKLKQEIGTYLIPLSAKEGGKRFFIPGSDKGYVYFLNASIWLGAITALVAGGAYAWKKLKKNGEDSDIDQAEDDQELVESVGV